MSDESMSNFTPRAQQVLALARKEADRFNHNYLGTEHILLGLIKLGQGVAVNVLQKMGSTSKPSAWKSRSRPAPARTRK
jgi:ATP-dependent Clp protease ATP-binding subunit ClpC